MIRITKKIALLSIIIILITYFSSCNYRVENLNSGVIVEDCIGRSIQVPKHPKAIATLDPFAGQAVIMLGYGDKMTGTVDGVKRDMLLQAICPNLADASVIKKGGSVNAEEVIALGIDLIFVKSDMYNNESEREKIEKLNIPYLVIDYNNMEEQRNALLIIGKALGKLDDAKQVVSYYESTIERVAKIVKEIPMEDRPKLYHAVNEATRTDDKGSLGADWISVTGAVNVSLEADLALSDKNYYTTLEQIFVWDPDLIICNESGIDKYILEDTKWAGLRAVRDGNVYQIPIGVSRWGHPSSSETPMAILWLAKLIYPDYFKELDIKEEIQYFYSTFFNYQVSEEEINKIIDGEGIRSSNN